MSTLRQRGGMGVGETPSTQDAMSAFDAPAERSKPAMSRVSTYAGVLSELDEIKESPLYNEHQRKKASPAPARPAANETAAKPTPPQPTSAFSMSSTEVILGSLVLSIAVAMPLGWPPAHWLIILGCLMTTAMLLLGVETCKTAYAEMRASPRASWLSVPLTDDILSIEVLNKFANSCQVREKGLKIVQYILKGGAYCGLFSKPVGSAMKSLSKTTSIARRFFKFCRWIKHFEDYKAAKEEKSSMMRMLLYIRVCANLGADWAEDVCSLERIGFLPKGTLSVGFMLFAEYCQLALALIEMCISTVMVRKQQEVSEVVESATLLKPGAEVPKAVLKNRRKLALMRLELVKFVSDIGKAIYDCELHFAHEGVFIGCSLFSALVSTHKNMVKVLK
jgi:hypothetical protein